MREPLFMNSRGCAAWLRAKLVADGVDPARLGDLAKLADATEELAAKDELAAFVRILRILSGLNTRESTYIYPIEVIGATVFAATQAAILKDALTGGGATTLSETLDSLKEGEISELVGDEMHELLQAKAREMLILHGFLSLVLMDRRGDLELEWVLELAERDKAGRSQTGFDPAKTRIIQRTSDAALFEVEDEEAEETRYILVGLQPQVAENPERQTAHLAALVTQAKTIAATTWKPQEATEDTSSAGEALPDVETVVCPEGIDAIAMSVAFHMWDIGPWALISLMCSSPKQVEDAVAALSLGEKRMLFQAPSRIQ